MHPSRLPSGPQAAPGAQRSALFLATEDTGLERFVQPLVRSNLSIRRVASWAEAVQIAYETPLDLFVVVLPVPGAARALEAVRAEGSSSIRAGILVVREGAGREESDREAAAFANLSLPPDFTSAQFEQATATLLGVAPRIVPHGSTPISITMALDSPRRSRVENLSQSGMLLDVYEPLPVGTIFGFTLDLPGQSEPIRGQAEVIRLAAPSATGGKRLAVRFVALGGTGADELRRLIERELANDNVDERPGRGYAHSSSASGASSLRSRPPALPALITDELGRCRNELEELTPILDGMLERGLAIRLENADWYLFSAENGLESLRSISAILASFQEEGALTIEASRRLADLIEARRRLAEIGKPEQPVATRVRILLGLRPALERLLRDFARSETPNSLGAAATAAPRIAVKVTVEIRRLISLRRNVQKLHDLLAQTLDLKLLLAPATLRRRLDRIAREQGAIARSVEIELDPAQLARRSARVAKTGAVRDVLQALELRLAGIHQKIRRDEPRRRAVGALESQLLDPETERVLVGMIAPGADLLARTYSAFRHALEATRDSPALLDRVERLGARLQFADRVATNTGSFRIQLPDAARPAAPSGSPRAS